MAKRKRNAGQTQAAKTNGTGQSPSEETVPATNGHDGSHTSHKSRKLSHSSNSTTIQIITGSYERVLHGFQARIPRDSDPSTSPANDANNHANAVFTDNFLFNAHTASIRCLALSPPTSGTPNKPNTAFLASGSTDEQIKLYKISTDVPPPSSSPTDSATAPVSLTGHASNPNPLNREVGALLHHSSPVTALHFISRSKLLTAALDSTIGVVRTRDWTTLSTFKSPIPIPKGRPSGDTAGPGEVPSGINDFAVHPSARLLLSVGKGERCMRLWNLVTGKRAGVLNFERDVLRQVGVTKHATGEAESVIWNAEGEEYTVGFERGAVVFGMDSTPKCLIIPTPSSKIHALHYVPSPSLSSLLALSTEDGRILFFDTSFDTSPTDTLPHAPQIAFFPAQSPSRIKAFELLLTPSQDLGATDACIHVVSASSDGAVRVWDAEHSDLVAASKDAALKDAGNGTEGGTEGERGKQQGREVGKLRGVYETRNRVTCLRAFVMGSSAMADGGGDAVRDERGEDEEADGERGAEGVEAEVEVEMEEEES